MNDTTTAHRPDGLRGVHAAGPVLLQGAGDGSADEYRPRHARPLQPPTQYDDSLVALAALAAAAMN